MSARKETCAAVKLYEDFRERKPRRIKKIAIAIPRIAVDIGYVEFIGYRTTHGDELTLYKHDFAAGSRPLMCVSPDGRQLLLLGGRYKFTAQGIVDRDARGKLITNPKHGRAINPRGPRKRKLPEDKMRPGEVWEFSGESVTRDYSGHGQVTIVNSHANRDRVTQTDNTGRQYENGHAHIPTAIVTTHRGKQIEVPTFTLKRIIKA